MSVFETEDGLTWNVKHGDASSLCSYNIYIIISHAISSDSSKSGSGSERQGADLERLPKDYRFDPNRDVSESSGVWMEQEENITDSIADR